MVTKPRTQFPCYYSVTILSASWPPCGKRANKVLCTSLWARGGSLLSQLVDQRGTSYMMCALYSPLFCHANDNHYWAEYRQSYWLEWSPGEKLERSQVHPCEGFGPSSYVLIVFSLRYFYRLKYSNVGTFHLILPSRSSIKVVSSLPDFTCCFELALSSLDIFSTPGTSSNLISRPGLLDTADCLPSTHPEPFPEISLFFSGDWSSNKSRMEGVSFKPQTILI